MVRPDAGGFRGVRCVCLKIFDGHDYYLVKEKLSPTTVNRRLGLAKSLFRVAVRHKLIAENPFIDAKTTNKTNPERQRFIDRETIAKIIDAAPSAEWRTLIALARYGGVRVPSEAVTLKWEDVDFVEGRITVYSPKTEHHAGKGTRQIPLFPELLPYLEDLRELAEAGARCTSSRSFAATRGNMRRGGRRLTCGRSSRRSSSGLG